MQMTPLDFSIALNKAIEREKDMDTMITVFRFTPFIMLAVASIVIVLA